MDVIVAQPLIEPELSYLQAVEQAVTSVAGQFQNEPGSFLYEADLHGLLFTRIFDILAKNPRRLRITDKRWKPMAFHELSINPAKSEGGARRPEDGPSKTETNGQNRPRFDISILAPEPEASENPWKLPLCAAIEIKLWQPEARRPPNILNDVKKLERYKASVGGQFTGLALLFSQNACNPAAVFPDSKIETLVVGSPFHLKQRQVSAYVIISNLAAR